MDERLGKHGGVEGVWGRFMVGKDVSEEVYWEVELCGRHIRHKSSDTCLGTSTSQNTDSAEGFRSALVWQRRHLE